MAQLTVHNYIVRELLYKFIRCILPISSAVQRKRTKIQKNKRNVTRNMNTAREHHIEMKKISLSATLNNQIT